MANLGIVDAAIVLRILKELVTDWKDTEAYKQGVIDENGTRLVRFRDMETSAQRNSYTVFHRFVFNIKRLIEKLPGGKTKIARIGSAMFLIREHYNLSDEDTKLLAEGILDILEQQEHLIENREITMSILNEESTAPTNITGNVDGMGAKPGDKIAGPRTFAGARCFDVDTGTYMKCRHGKKKYARWAKYIDEEDLEQAEIKDYARKNPQKNIIIRDKSTKHMMWLRKMY